jgi:hypothetical protein
MSNTLTVRILQPSPISIDEQLVWLQPGEVKTLPAGIAQMLIQHEMAEECGAGESHPHC